MKEIDTSLSSNLDWSNPPDNRETYFLNFDFSELDLFDISTFNAYFVAMESFSIKYPNCRKVIMAVLSGDFSFIRKDTEKFEKAQKEAQLPNNLVCANLFSDYLHRLAAILPENAKPTILIQRESSKKLAEMIWLFCKRRFEHFEIEFDGFKLPICGQSTRILSLPDDQLLSLKKLDRLLQEYHGCVCIPEEYLNEHWDNATEILYDSKTTGEIGKRMLLGFQAAGGITKKVR